MSIELSCLIGYLLGIVMLLLYFGLQGEEVCAEMVMIVVLWPALVVLGIIVAPFCVPYHLGKLIRKKYESKQKALRDARGHNRDRAVHDQPNQVHRGNATGDVPRTWA